MCHAYRDGAPGVLVSGLVWITAALVCHFLDVNRAVWALLIGGALIFPISVMVTKAIGRPARAKDNALNQLAMASTIWLILCCAMAYGLFLLKPTLFFPAMMGTIGCRYLVFASVYGRVIFWIMGASLVVAGYLAYFWTAPPAIAAGIGGLIELTFAAIVFLNASKRVATSVGAV
jgi:hypothetical protein